MVTVDLHTPQIEGFFHAPVDSLTIKESLITISEIEALTGIKDPRQRQREIERRGRACKRARFVNRIGFDGHQGGTSATAQ
jgi:hypothetical protein